MYVNLNLWVFLVISQNLFQFIFAQSCDSSILVESPNNFLLISDKPATIKTAQNSCSSAGGNLAQITSKTASQRTRSYMTKNLIPRGLALVTVYENKVTPNVVKYRSSSGNKNTFSLIGWKAPDRGKLKSFYLYQKSTDPFTQKLLFCSSIVSGYIGNSCLLLQRLNFEVYGALPSVENTITFYCYYNSVSQSTVLSLNSNLNTASLTKVNYSNGIKTVSIPDFSILCGIQSAVNSTTWSWNNGTAVADSNLPLANKSVCQHMLWSLTYDDGINLIPKPCSFAKSYYVCKIKFEIKVTSVECNVSLLVVTWKGIEHINNKTQDLQVEIQVNGTKYETIPYKMKSLTIKNLKRRTFYEITAVIFTTNCTSLTYASSFATTSFGTPDSVENPRVLYRNSPIICMIEWSLDHEHSDHIDYYKITANNHSMNVTTASLKKIENDFQYQVDLSNYQSERFVYFKIQAFSCNGGSQLTPVLGFCLVTQISKFSIYVVIGPVLGLLAIVIIATLFCICSRKHSESSTKPDEQENIDTIYLQPRYQKQDDEQKPKQENVAELSYDHLNAGENASNPYANMQVCSRGIENPAFQDNLYEAMK